MWIRKCVDARAQKAGANSRRGATKKDEISRNLLSINLHFYSSDRSDLLEMIK